MECKDCKWCTWACPGYMCMNPMNPKMSDDDYPVVISLHDSCELIERGENDYQRLTKK